MRSTTYSSIYFVPGAICGGGGIPSCIGWAISSSFGRRRLSTIIKIDKSLVLKNEWLSSFCKNTACVYLLVQFHIQLKEAQIVMKLLKVIDYGGGLGNGFTFFIPILCKRNLLNVRILIVFQTGYTLWQFDIPGSIIKLTSRYHRVIHGNVCLSEWGKRPTFVPLQSKLGPWLFFNLINDLSNSQPFNIWKYWTNWGKDEQSNEWIV